MLRCHLSFSRRIPFFKYTALIESKLPFKTLGNEVLVSGIPPGTLRGGASHFNSVGEERLKHVESSSLKIGYSFFEKDQTGLLSLSSDIEYKPSCPRDLKKKCQWLFSTPVLSITNSKNQAPVSVETIYF